MLIRLSLLGTYAVGLYRLRTFVLGAGLILVTTSNAVQAGGEGQAVRNAESAESESQVGESVWGCLLYASNERAAEKTPAQIPAHIRTYDERLEKLLGYASIRTLGQGQTRVQPSNSGSIVFHGNIRIELTGLTPQPGDHFLVGLRLFHGDHQLIETQAKVTRGSPLFIRGPLWREGQLVVAVMVIS